MLSQVNHVLICIIILFVNTARQILSNIKIAHDWAIIIVITIIVENPKLEITWGTAEM